MGIMSSLKEGRYSHLRAHPLFSFPSFSVISPFVEVRVHHARLQYKLPAESGKVEVMGMDPPRGARVFWHAVELLEKVHFA